MQIKKNFGKCVSIGVLIILCGFLAGYFCLQIWIDRKSENVNPDARPAFHAALKSYLLGRVTGDDWSGDVFQQSKIVSKFQLNARLDYYRELLLICDFDTSNADLFIDLVGDDMQSLYENMQSLKVSYRYQNLPVDEQKKVDKWLVEIKNILEYKQTPWV